jgi:hypothetical protein
LIPSDGKRPEPSLQKSNVVATEIASDLHTTQNRSKEEQLTLIGRNHTSSEVEAIICFAAGAY